jgi:XTP/dITP diphosphohydrolase
MKIYFVTTSTFKAQEIADFLSQSGGEPYQDIDICIVAQQLQEILHRDIDIIVRHKALAAYQSLTLPCFVEHSGIFMDALPGLPGGVGQIIWNAIGDRMCDFLREGDSRAATARSVIGYCDGRHVRLYEGETRGQIAGKSRGAYNSNWDPIFIPEGSDQTYGEMGVEKKRATSPIIKAWEAFLKAEVSRDHPLPDTLSRSARSRGSG